MSSSPRTCTLYTYICVFCYRKNGVGKGILHPSPLRNDTVLGACALQNLCFNVQSSLQFSVIFACFFKLLYLQHLCLDVLDVFKVLCLSKPVLYTNITRSFQGFSLKHMHTYKFFKTKNINNSFPLKPTDAMFFITTL